MIKVSSSHRGGLAVAVGPGCQHEISASEDIHTVASLLKLYLRELPEPLVPFVCYSHFQSAVKSKWTPLE